MAAKGLRIVSQDIGKIPYYLFELPVLYIVWEAKVNSRSCILHCLHCWNLWETHLVSSPNELSTSPETDLETGFTSNRPGGNHVSQSQVSFLLLKARFENVHSSPHSWVSGPSQAARDAQRGVEFSVLGTQRAVCVPEWVLGLSLLVNYVALSN